MNYINTIRLVKYFSKKQSYIIIFSTSQVVENFKETREFQLQEPPNTIYGKSKYLLEQHLKLIDAKICIIRSTKIIDSKYELFKKWVFDLKNKNQITPFEDIYFSPISISFMLDVINKCLINEFTGLIQVSANSEITYSEAAILIAKKLNLDQTLIYPILHQNAKVGHVPKNSILSSNVHNFQLNPPSPEVALDFFINNYKE